MWITVNEDKIVLHIAYRLKRPSRYLPLQVFTNFPEDQALSIPVVQWDGVLAESLSDQVVERIGRVAENYYRLILVVGPSGSGKTRMLLEVCDRTDMPIINVNLDLSRNMLELTGRQRALQVPKILGEILNAFDSKIVLLDNIEVLFAPSLKQDPLRLLQNLSRNKTLVVAWNGSVSGGHITYTVPEHPEYRRYPVHDFLVVNAEPSQKQGSPAVGNGAFVSRSSLTAWETKAKPGFLKGWVSW